MLSLPQQTWCCGFSRGTAEHGGTGPANKAHARSYQRKQHRMSIKMGTGAVKRDMMHAISAARGTSLRQKEVPMLDDK
jgi:hypothetical protein